MNTVRLLKTIKKLSDENKNFLKMLVSADNPSNVISDVLFKNNIFCFSVESFIYKPKIDISDKFNILLYLFLIGVIDKRNQFTNEYTKEKLKNCLELKNHVSIRHNIFSTEINARI